MNQPPIVLLTGFYGSESCWRTCSSSNRSPGAGLWCEGPYVSESIHASYELATYLVCAFSSLAGCCEEWWWACERSILIFICFTTSAEPRTGSQSGSCMYLFSSYVCTYVPTCRLCVPWAWPLPLLVLRLLSLLCALWHQTTLDTSYSTLCHQARIPWYVSDEQQNTVCSTAASYAYLCIGTSL